MNNILDLIYQIEPAFYSGGANGADYLFTKYALENNFTVFNFSFENHKSNCPEDTIYKLTTSMLVNDSVLNAIKDANRKIQRKVPKVGSYVYNLLARNYYQVFSTERVYAISELINPCQISGGTAWATQFYIDSEQENKELYLFDLISKEPYQYDFNLKEYVKVNNIPAPHGRFTGIGSRKATEHDFELMIQYFKMEK